MSLSFWAWWRWGAEAPCLAPAPSASRAWHSDGLHGGDCGLPATATVRSCYVLPTPHEKVGLPGLPALAAGHASAAGRPSCQLQTAGGARHHPGGAPGGRPAPPAPAALSFSSSPAQSPATKPTPPGRGGSEAQFSLFRLPQGLCPPCPPLRHGPFLGEAGAI